MDTATIKVHFQWFGAQADSWGVIGENCKNLADALWCQRVTRQEPLMGSVYDAYDAMVGAFTTSTDGESGHGYGAGAQVAERIKERLLETSYAYARTEAANAEAAAEIEKLIASDIEARR